MFRPSLRSTVTTLAAAAVLVGGADLASYAATGNAFILGHANTAGTTTALRNSGRGPALSLNSARSAPPLVVNSSKMVKHLNASMVGGLNASKLSPTAGLYLIGKAGGTINTSPHLFAIKPPAGYVHWAMTGVWTSSGPSTDGLTCLVLDKRLLNHPSNIAFVYAEFLKSISDPDAPFIQQQGYSNFTKKQTLLIGCEASGTGPFKIAQPITFSFQSLNAKVKHGTPFTPRTPLRKTPLS